MTDSTPGLGLGFPCPKTYNNALVETLEPRR